jgi:hypothetical protein
MSNSLTFILIYLIGEVISTVVFKIIRYSLEKKVDYKIDRQVLKGILERLFLFLALIYKLPQALIAFAAIKIGTRFIETEDKISSDYFFIPLHY